MAQISPYINFNGNCEAAFNHYKSVFGGEFEYIGRFGEMPPGEKPLPEEEKNQIMHISLPISNGISLLGSDCPSSYGSMKFGDNVSISINAENAEEAKRLFDGLSAGGIIKMPLEKTFWAALFGMFEDKFGIHWMVNYDEPRQG